MLSEVLQSRAFVWCSVLLTVAIYAFVIIGTPYAVRRLPSDFFSDPRHLAPRRRRQGRSRLVWWAGFVARHLAGIAFIILGTVFLQGVLVVILGLALMDFRGKGAAIRRLATIGFVWRLMARIRERAGLPPLERPEAAEKDG